MVVNGASRRSVEFWTKHLANDKKNDRAELREIRGLAAKTLGEGLREMEDDARQTRCKNFFYQANFNPCPHERLTDEQWDKAFEIFEKHRGIPEGQARIVYEHEKEGRIHRHVIWSRIDLEKMRAWPDQLDAKVCHAASREISEELGLERTISPYDKDREGPPPERAPKSYEMFRGLRSGLDPRDIKAEVTAIFRESLNAEDFAAGLRQHGYELIQGDRRDFCILDSAGDVHSLARRLNGINTKQLRLFMQDIDMGSVPTVEQAKMHLQERVAADRLADLATVKNEIAWEEALVRAGIEKEKTEREFVEPTPAQIKERERAERRWPIEPPKPEPITTSPAYHFEDLAHETTVPKAERNAPPRGIPAHIWTAWHQSDNARAFAASLDEHGISLAAVTKDEADRSHREAEFARAIGHFAPRYREGEIVAVTEPRQCHRRDGEVIDLRRVYQLNRYTTGEERAGIDRFLRSLDRTDLQGIEATKEALNTRSDQRTAEVQAFRDMLRDKNYAARINRAQEPGYQGRVHSGRGKGKSLAKALHIATNAPGIALLPLAKTVDIVSNVLESVFAAPQTPEQKIDGEVATRGREADAAETVDFSRFAAEREVHKMRDRGQKEREGGGRER